MMQIQYLAKHSQHHSVETDNLIPHLIKIEQVQKSCVVNERIIQNEALIVMSKMDAFNRTMCSHLLTEWVSGVTSWYSWHFLMSKIIFLTLIQLGAEGKQVTFMTSTFVSGTLAQSDHDHQLMINEQEYTW